MSETGDSKKQIRLDQHTYEKLFLIQKNCGWPVSLNVLGNHAICHGIGNTRRIFNPKKK